MNPRIRRLFLPAGLLVGLLVVVLHGLAMTSPKGTVLTLLERHWEDSMQASSPAQAAPSQVVVAAIDAKAIDRLGRWPWSRERLAELTRVLSEHYEARLIGFDIILSEPGDQDVRALLDDLQHELPALPWLSSAARATVRASLEDSRRRFAGDARLAEALQASGRVVLGMAFYGSKQAVAHLTPQQIGQSAELLAATRLRLEPPRLRRGMVPLGRAPEIPLPDLLRAARSAGLLNVVPDPEDGSLRRAHLVMQLGPALYPSLALELVRLHEGASEAVAEIDRNGLLSGIRVGGRHVETDSDGSIRLNYRGPEGTIPHLSVADLLDRSVPVDAVAGRIVIVGATDVGLGDRRVTPVSVTFPGVEAQATIVDNLLRGDYFRHSLTMDVVTFLLIVALALPLSLAAREMPLAWATALWGVLLVGWPLLHRPLVLWLHGGPAMVPVLLTVLLAGALTLTLRLLASRRF